MPMLNILKGGGGGQRTTEVAKQGWEYYCIDHRNLSFMEKEGEGAVKHSRHPRKGRESTE